ncbi:MAG: hypothetical protein KDK04_18325, partial [Candidatus Competibacteraceae bacterium]|nr:hypothetical protein [Candidatus Competibacteraceae bacterium]
YFLIRTFWSGRWFLLRILTTDKKRAALSGAFFFIFFNRTASDSLFAAHRKQCHCRHTINRRI